MTVDFGQRLAALDATFVATSAVGGLHPEGTFIGEIKRAAVEETKKQGDDTLNLNIQIKTEKGTAFANLRLTNFSSEGHMGWTKGQLSNLGHTGTLSALVTDPSILGGLIGQNVEIVVDHEEGNDTTFVNVNIKKRVGGPAAGSPFAAPANVAPVNAFTQAPAQGVFTPQPPPTPAEHAQMDAAGFPPSPVAPQSPSEAVAAAPTPLPFG